MDYRAVAVERLSWHGGKVQYGASSVSIQTPPCRCRCAPNSRFGPLAMDVTLHVASPGFAEFVRRVERSASASASAVAPGRQWRECLSYTGDMRLTTYDDTKWFGEDGTYADAPLKGMGACACILQLAGVWISPTSWGLKWRVKELKALDRSTCRAPAAQASWAFREDSTLPFRGEEDETSWAFREFEDGADAGAGVARPQDGKAEADTYGFRDDV